jgi:predicted PurR-regulated permease PerM
MTPPDQVSSDQPDAQPIIRQTWTGRPLWSAITPSDVWWHIAGAGAIAIALGLGMLWGISLLAQPLALLAFAITLAESLAPIANWLDRWLPRALAVVLVYLALLLVLAAIGYALIPTLASQIREVSSRIPDLVKIIQEWLASRNLQIGGNVLNALTSQIGSVSSALVSLPIAIFSSLFDIVLIFFISIYWLIQAPAILDFFLSLFPEGRRERVGSVVGKMGREMGGFIRGAFLDGLVIGASTYIGLLVLGIDYALVLGMLAGLLEFIPWVGPIIAAVPVVGSALLQSPTKALLALGFILVLHQFEGNIVLPNIMYTQTEISPLLVILALLAGGAIGGILGAIIAIPLAAALRVFVREVIAPAVRHQTGAVVPARPGSRQRAGEAETTGGETP